MKKLLIGTTNKAKIATYTNLLKEFNFNFVTPKDLNIESPEEIGDTLEEVAIRKAKYYYEKTGLPTLVDDGGFEIEALNGEPGVKSHRWLGYPMSDQEIVNEVMKRMKDVSEDNRQAKFTVVLAVAAPFGVITSHADLQGVVGLQPSDKLTPGYPYDSVLYLPNYNGFVSELDEADYDIINHRKHAVEKIKDIFAELSKG